MAQIIHNISTPNDGLGDELRTAFEHQNEMNTDLYTNKVDKVIGKDLSDNNFSDADVTKLAGIEAGAEVNVQADWLQDDDTQDDFIKNKPDQLFASVGYFHISDLATQTTPLTFVASTPLKLTNDGGGVFTSEAQAPYGITKAWNSSLNELDFTQLSVGDTVLVRTDLSISTTSLNQNIKLYIKFGIGSASEYDLLIDSWNEKSVITFEEFIKDVSFSIDNEDWRDFPANIYILSDDDGEVKINGWYIPIIRKSVNVIDFNSDPLKQDVLTPVNFGAFMDTELPIKLTPSPNDNFLGRDSITNESVEFNYPIVEGYFNGTNFYLESGFINLITATSGRTYIDLATNLQYRWSGSAYVQLSAGIDSELHKSWYSITWRKDAAGALPTNVNGGNYAGAGTTSLINASGVSRLTSFWATNYLSASTAGAICGLRQQLTSETALRSGYESYFIFKNNDTNVNAQTIMGFTSLVADFPNVAFSAYTGDFQGVGNDVGDTNLSFILKTAASFPNGVLASYTKIPLGSSFPAHTTSDVYMLKIEAPQTEVRANQFIKMTITNLINGATATHTFESSLCPFLSASICLKMQRSARNSGIATNIGLFKFYFKHNLY